MNEQRITRRGLFKLGGAAALTTAASGAATGPMTAQAGPAFTFGTYTSGGGPGIAGGHLDPVTGKPMIEQTTAAVKEASWLAAGPSGGIRYAVSEQNAGTVSALAPDLTVLNTVATGAGPAHVAVHPGGRFLFVSLYNGGAVVTHPIAANGTVGAATDVRPQRLNGRQSHAHQVVVDPTGTRVLAVDLGVDTVFSYTLDPRGILTETSRTTLTTGSGPRHLAFHPGGTVAYLLNELNSTVTVCAWSGGTLRPGQSLPAAPQSGVTNRPAEIIVSADGRFVYVSNRGTNTVGVFATSAGGSMLSRIAAPACGGDWPRHLALDPTGTRLYVANQRSGTVAWLPVDPATGVPGAAAGSVTVAGAAHILF